MSALLSLITVGALVLGVLSAALVLVAVRELRPRYKRGA